MKKRHFIFITAALFLASIVFFAKPIFCDKLIVPTDILKFYQPWSYYAPDAQLHNHYLSDIVSQTFPWEQYIYNGLSRGWDSLLWCTFLETGYPLASGAPYMIYNPVNIVYCLFDFFKAYNLFFVIELFLAGLFMALFLRELGINPWAVFIGSLAFMFNLSFITAMLFKLYLGPVIYLPLIILFAMRYYRSQRVVYLLAAGFVTGISFLGGAIQGQLICALAITAYLISYLAAGHGFRLKSIFTPDLIKVLSVIFFTAILVAAINLIPVLEFLPLNSRSIPFSIAAWLRALPAKLLFLPFLALGSVWPDMIGSHHALDLVKFITFSGGRETLSGVNFKIYLGLVPVVFYLSAVYYQKNEREVKVFVYMLFFIIFTVILTPLYLLVYTRFFIACAFPIAALAALGADGFLKAKDRKERSLFIANKIKAVFLVAVFLITFLNIFLAAYKNPLLNYGKNYIIQHLFNSGRYIFDVSWQLAKVDKMIANYSLASPGVLFAFCTLLLLYILFLMHGKGVVRLKTMFFIFAVIAFLDLYRNAWDFLPLSNEAVVFTRTPETDFVMKDKGLFRVAVLPGDNEYKPLFPSNTLLGYGISTTDIYEGLVLEKPLLNENLYSLYNIKYVYTSGDRPDFKDNRLELVYNDKLRIYRNNDALPRAFWAGKYILVDNVLEAKARLYGENFNYRQAVILYRDDFKGSDHPLSVTPGKGIVSQAAVRILHYGSTLVKIDTDAPSEGFLVLSDRLYPGWNVYVDGKKSKIYRAYTFLRAVFLSKGRHEVKFVYHPLSVYAGGLLTVFSSVSLVLYFLLIGIKNRGIKNDRVFRGDSGL